MVLLIVLVALSFDFLNGFHDAANSIATVVSTRVLSPRRAVVWAAFFNFVAAFGISLNVATTIGKGIVDPRAITNLVILAGLLGGIVWDLVTWYCGLPISSSHALIGGLIGSAVVAGGPGVLVWSGIQKTLLFIVLSPVIGLVLGFTLMLIVLWIFQKGTPYRVDRMFRRLQLASSALVSLGHGTNDAQKTMGVIAALLFANGYLGPRFFIPTWVVLVATATIAAGTLAGGWRIVKTMGMKITKLEPVGGFCTETAAALSILGASFGGIPVSTTHTISGAIMGVGATKRLSAVRWGVATRIIWAWVVTIPAAAAVAAIAHVALKAFLR
ncbi:MAG TPA: inorganic phosphate transporter [bacterium]|nr:inorganic phosphate transporter [bacterium]